MMTTTLRRRRRGRSDFFSLECERKAGGGGAESTKSRRSWLARGVVLVLLFCKQTTRGQSLALFLFYTRFSLASQESVSAEEEAKQ